MKKILLLLSILTISYSSIIAATASGNLNPFAYDLSATFDKENMTLYISFKVNAPAQSIVVKASDGEQEYDLYSLSDTKTKIEVKDVPIKLLDKGLLSGTFTWRVVVTDTPHSSADFVSNSSKLYYPTSIDIDNNPENANFGTVFCIEGRHNAANGSGYISSIDKNGAGLYVFNADGTPRPLPRKSFEGFGVEVERYGWNGGKSLGDANCRTIGGVTGFAPYRVRVSKDGRIFITSQTSNGEVLYEANQNVFSDKTGTYWNDRFWYRVISQYQNDGTTPNAYVKMRESNKEVVGACTCGLTECNIYNLYNISTEKFVAGPNVGFDVRGSGNELQLLMLSGCKQAIANFTPSHFYCSEYNLGTATTWNTAPTTYDKLKGYVLRSDAAQVLYDKDGNIWICHYIKDGEKLTDSEPYYPLLKYNRATGTITKYNGIVHNYHRCGAMRFNHDFTKLAITTRGGTTGTGGYVTIYPIINGEPDFNSGTEIDLRSEVGLSMMDIAWDYADNLYIAADKAGESSYGRCIGIYAMPNNNGRNVVSTPARTGFTIECTPGVYYTITANSNNQDWGTVTMTSKKALVGGKVPSCAEVIVTATPTEHHRFVEWKVGEETVSTDPTYSFYAIKDLTITAHFAYAKHNVTWNNLFMNGKDIGTENLHYQRINERLWRMFQARYKDYHKNATIAYSYAADADAYSLDGRTYVRTDSLLLVSIKNETAVSKSMDVQNFMNNDEKFKWLKEYILSHNPTQQIGTDKAWVYHLFGFFNRTNKIYYNSTTAITDYTFKGNYEEWGKPEHWAPIWTEKILGLPQTMEYGDYTPIDWVHEEDYNKCPFRGRWVGGWHIDTDNNNEFIIQRPDAWYISYKVQNIGEPLTNNTHILAWRNGSINGGIVTIINGDMDLYATYVEKNIDEYDVVPAKPENYDATNDDVIKLLQNPNYLDGTHDLTISRQLQAGMYNTICLPFDLNLNALTINHPFYGAKAMQFTGVTPLYNESNEPVTVLQFTEVTRLEKGVPYLIQVQNDVVRKTRFSGIHRDNLTSITQQITPNGSPITFHGTINPTEIPAQSLILVANNRLAQTTVDGDMAGMRGYFSIDPAYAQEIAEQAANGRVYLNFQKPSTTSIPVAPEAEQSTKLNVEKLIIDGHLYILRGGEVYTITGSRVR